MGTTNVNGTNRTVTVVDANRFTVALSASTAYVSGGLVTSAQVVLTTDAPHGIPASNAPITVSGVGGNTAANGNKTVTVLDATHLLLVSTAPNGDYTGGGTFTSAPVIVTTGSPHGLTAGRIVVQDVAGNTAANGTWSTTLIDSSRLLLNGVRRNGTYAGGGHYGNPPGTLVSGATNASPIVLHPNGPHGLSTGNTVTVAGALGNTAANGTFVVTAVSPNQIVAQRHHGQRHWTSGGAVSGAQLNVTIDGLRSTPRVTPASIATAPPPPCRWCRSSAGSSEIGAQLGVHRRCLRSGCSFTCTTNVDYAFQVQTGAVTFARQPGAATSVGRSTSRQAHRRDPADGGHGDRQRVHRHHLPGRVAGQRHRQPDAGRHGDRQRLRPDGQHLVAPAGITIVNGGNTISGNTFIGPELGHVPGPVQEVNTRTTTTSPATPSSTTASGSTSRRDPTAGSAPPAPPRAPAVG